MTGLSKQFPAILVPLLLVVLFPISLSAARPAEADKAVHHDLKIVLHPKEHRLIAEDSVTLPELSSSFRFLLHKGLNPSSPTPGVKVVREAGRHGDDLTESYTAKLPPGTKAFTLKYAGKIFHSIEPYGKEQARGMSQTPGIIAEEGVSLSGSSFWYPASDNGFVSFSLDVELPAGWDAVSQGERLLHEKGKKGTLVRWESPEPQDQIFLVAARFTEYSRPTGRISAMAFLRGPDRELADKYLDATARYIAMYEKLLGPYPYRKFALVENFWETGFGMPSFTLLGPKIIRFPFIIDTSYPHEILHNWWGNGVYADYAKGNWSEGLTAYLSDHLMKEQQGNGAEYRQTTLQKYADYVSKEKDFPLTEFRSRHSSSTEAIGYGKALMLFHMLRQELGDRVFVQALQDFYRANKFRLASFDDLQKSFERISRKDLKRDFDQWVMKPGAPKIRVTNAVARAERDSWVLTALIEQLQSGAPYLLRIPVAVTMEGQERAYQTDVVMSSDRIEMRLRLPHRPLRLDVDAEFDLFRRLDREELPPALSQALGAGKMLILLPSSAGGALLQAYREFAKALGESGPDKVEIRLDREVKDLPSDRAVAILGWENRFLHAAKAALSRYDVSLDPKDVRLGRTELPVRGHSFAFSARSLHNRDMPLLLIASGLAEALPGLARKLPHYHKYSYLGFEGNEPANMLKGRWPVLDSPMTLFLPDDKGALSRVEMGRLARREPLATLAPRFSSERMMETIRFLSGDELNGRGFGFAGLDRAADYIAAKFREAGLMPAGDGERSFFEVWEERGGDPEETALMKNVIGIVPGNNSERSDESLVIGAHYDHLGYGWPDVRAENRGKVHPGADDNASGVAVLVELARLFAETKPDCTLVFVAFTGEEAGRRGSRHYVATRKRYPVDKTIGMLNLDTVGRLGKKKLLVLGTNSAGEWAHILKGAGFVTGVEIETVSERLDSSDQVSFEEAGVPAVQLFTGPHLDYHRPSDTIDKIDPEGLVKVASVAKEVVEYLAGRRERLTLSAQTEKDQSKGLQKERKASLGIIPDFAFSGKGCLLSGVAPRSPAEACGLKEGDIIIRINSEAVNSLRDLSDVLKALAPGARISITFLRGGKEATVEATVAAK